MIVVDTSIFIDLLFEYNSERTANADRFFGLLEKRKIPIFQPDIFRIEFIGQISRRIKRKDAIKIAEDFFKELNFIGTNDVFEAAFTIAFETGSRAIDSFYIATAKVSNNILVSNDKFQVESARMSGIEVYYLIEDFEKFYERIDGI